MPGSAVDAGGRIASFRRSPSLRFFFVAVLAVMLSIPLFAVFLLVFDRQGQASVAAESIAEGWGANQQVAGPFLVVPVIQPGLDGRGQARRDWLIVAPAHSKTDVHLTAEKRRRSIYEAVVYTSAIEVSGVFEKPIEASDPQLKGAVFQFDQAAIVYAVSGPRGISGEQPKIAADGETLRTLPGTTVEILERNGFSAWAPKAFAESDEMRFAVSLKVRGSNSFDFQPAGRDTLLEMQSNWPSPSFKGGFLPLARTVKSDGFKASWRVNDIALNRLGLAFNAWNPAHNDMVSVRFLNEGDLYAKVNRAAKYGFLVILITFVAILMVDLSARADVPALGYMLVGGALLLFFLLLLSLAEVIGFLPAYVLATLATVGLVTAYMSALLRSWRQGLGVGVMLAALYALLFVLLSLEAYALLVGTLALFLMLAAVMYFTRKLNWDVKSAEGTLSQTTTNTAAQAAAN